ncbi:MAG: D-amino acid dehydrogenase [Alsobacter sp.]
MRIVVLGAGIVGATSAYALAADGHEVVVLDRQPAAGLETSFANGGLVTPATSDSWAAPGTPLKILKWLGRNDAPMLLRLTALPGMLRWGVAFLAQCRPEPWTENTRATLSMALESVEELRRITALEGLSYDRNPPGLLKIFRSRDSMEAALRAARLYEDLGMRLERLDGPAALAREPALEPIRDKVFGAVYYPDDESGDAFKFTQAIAEAAARRGVEFRYGATVRRLRSDGDGIAGVQTDRGEVVGDCYVLALGSYTPGIAATVGVDLPIYPAKGYSISLDAPGWNGAPRIPIADDALKAAVTPLGDTLRVAGTVEFAGHDTSLNARRGQLLEDSLAAILPAHPKGKVRHWAGLRPLTPSGRPIIGRAGHRNLYVNAGHGPLGWTLAAGSSRRLARMIAETAAGPR